MRIWGRDGAGVWHQTVTAPNGDNELVRIVNLAQVLLLGLGESPFFGNYGIPAQQTVATQVFPDLYVWITQSQFAIYFASLVIARQLGPNPSYNVSVLTKNGASITAEVLF